MFITKPASIFILLAGSALAHVAQPQPDVASFEVPAAEYADLDANIDTVWDKSAFVRGQIARVSTETTNLNAALSAWDGNLVTVINIKTAGDKLNGVISDAATQIATNLKSPKMGLISAGRLKKPIEELIKLTSTTVDHFIAEQQKFRKLDLHGEVKSTFAATLNASKEMNNAIIKKLPQIAHGPGRMAGRKMNDILNKGIKAFS